MCEALAADNSLCLTLCLLLSLSLSLSLSPPPPSPPSPSTPPPSTQVTSGNPVTALGNHVAKDVYDDLKYTYMHQRVQGGVKNIVRILQGYFTKRLSSSLHKWRMLAYHARMSLERESKITVDLRNYLHTDGQRRVFRFLGRVVQKIRARAFNRWRAWSYYVSGLQSLQEKDVEAENRAEHYAKEIKRLKAKLRRVHDGSRARMKLITTRYGRDKVVAVINARKQCNLRVGFERWRMKSMLKRRSDGVRRGQLKLRVREDEISVERTEFERAKLQLQRSQKLFGTYVAFQKWSVMRGQRAREKQMQQIIEEREMIRTKLSNLYNLMVQASEAEAAQVQRAESMGSMLTKDLSVIEDALKEELKACVRSQAEAEEETKK